MVYDIRDYGAISDGKTMNTEAINAAIQTCARKGGGRVVVPAGGVFMTGTIWLQSHVELHLEHGAVLKGSGDMKDYCTSADYYQNYDVPDEQWGGEHLIVALECEDVAITGTGTINGNAWAFVSEKDVLPENTSHYYWKLGLIRAQRPGQCINFVECKHVRVENIALRDMASWGLFLFGCDYVEVSGISVINTPILANTDGIDIDACRYVTVSNCLIDTGDDAIAIRNVESRLKDKGRVCEYITITNCSLASSTCMCRIGVGTGGVLKHIRVSNIVAYRGETIAAFCTEWADVCRSPMYDVNFSNISATGISYPFYIRTHVGVPVQNVTFENIRCEATAAAFICSDVPGAVKNITVKDVDIFLQDDLELTDQDRKMRGEYALECRNVEGLTLDHVRVFGSDEEMALWSGKFNVENCPDMLQKDCKF